MLLDVYAPFKILSLLIRCLDNEIVPVENDQDNERLEMDEGEDEDYDKTQ